VTVRALVMHALAALGPPAPAGQIGFGARFIDEDQPRRVPARLLPAPGPAGPRDVRPVLFAGPERLFLYVSPSFANA